MLKHGSMAKPATTKSASSAEKATSYPFLECFPGEIRNLIYGYALTFNGTLRRLWYKGAKPAVDISIMLANKTVYQETFIVFYRENLFAVPYLAFSSREDPGKNPWLPRGSRLNTNQLRLIRRIELYNPLGELNFFRFDIDRLQVAWENRDDIKYLGMEGFVEGFQPYGRRQMLKRVLERLDAFFTFRNVSCVKLSLTFNERDFSRYGSEWEMANCRKEWTDFLSEMKERMEGPREPFAGDIDSADEGCADNVYSGEG
jgi:hypothetical protein